ncbi:MAG: ankyrin repeat domain-containing protein [Candidatus Omnitrophica bacterium]|nr:ankyrin repeat domain-containing protein [Candidatus Omnitrophota bacterium]
MQVDKINAALLQAVYDNNIEAARRCINEGAIVNTRDPRSGLSLLMIASGYGYAGMVKLLLSFGADVNMLDPLAGASVLHKACQRGSLEIVKLLVEAGAFVNLQTVTTGHTPLIDAIWYTQPEIVEYLLSVDAGLDLHTSYGFTLTDHLNYALKVNLKGKDKLLKIQELIQKRQAADKEKVITQKLTAAVTANDLKGVKEQIQAKADIEARAPILNGFDDGYTPLLIAARNGNVEIVKELLKAGADPNATDAVFVAVPLHKATYHGHLAVTEVLAKHPGVNLDFQGASNGYTPLHDALWHGFKECAMILIEAGASVSIKGHDGKTPLDIAREVFGNEDDIVMILKSKNKV